MGLKTDERGSIPGGQEGFLFSAVAIPVLEHIQPHVQSEREAFSSR
jgi:hypothetical protein